jgi:hypothetical protein
MVDRISGTLCDSKAMTTGHKFVWLTLAGLLAVAFAVTPTLGSTLLACRRRRSARDFASCRCIACGCPCRRRCTEQGELHAGDYDPHRARSFRVEARIDSRWAGRQGERRNRGRRYKWAEQRFGARQEDAQGRFGEREVYRSDLSAGPGGWKASRQRAVSAQMHGSGHEGSVPVKGEINGDRGVAHSDDQNSIRRVGVEKPERLHFESSAGRGSGVGARWNNGRALTARAASWNPSISGIYSLPDNY